MHIVALTLLLVVLFLIYYHSESFVASYDMMINRAKNPLFTNYHGREKDAYGNDYYDHFLSNQLSTEYERKYKNEGDMQFQTLRFLAN